MTPQEIYNESFRQIRQGLGTLSCSSAERHIIEWVIHATADWEYRDTMRFHEDALETGITALRQKFPIVTDVRMVAAGFRESLIASLGLRSYCYLDHMDGQRQNHITRSAWGIRHAARILGNDAIVVVANAPTALMETIRLIHDEGWRPKVVIGVPVGFVGARESKERLATDRSSVPFVTNLSMKGGSAAGAAVINAMMTLASEQYEQYDRQ